MLHIGCHLSSSKGFYHMGKDALAIGANTFQFFTRNPRGSKAKALNLEDIQKLLILMEENHFGPLLAHAPYTLNPASAKESTREFALQTMEDDLTRLEHLPGSYYNFHPGSHVEQGVEKGTQLIIDTLNTILEKSYTTTILLETMAGKGTEIGKSFEELQGVIEGVHNGASLGVCLDTCHVFDAGYDIVNHLDEVLEKFDHIIGLNKLKAIHINDSKNTLGSHKDRHEKIGDGSIGLPAFIQIINHPKLRRLPFFLETPNELEGYQKEIALLKENYQK